MSLVFLCSFKISLCRWNQVSFSHDCWAILIRWYFSFSISTVLSGSLILSFDDFLHCIINLLIQHLILKASYNEFFLKISSFEWFDPTETVRISRIFFVSFSVSTIDSVPTGNYMFNVNNRNTRTRCEICSNLTVKTPDGVFIVNFEHISHLVLVFLSLTLSR